MDNNPYQQPPQNNPQPQPWEENQQNQHQHHEGHHPHHGEHHGHHHDHQQHHNPTFTPYESPGQQQAQHEAYPTQIPPEVTAYHEQHAIPQPVPQPEFVSPAPAYQPPQEQYVASTPPQPSQKPPVADITPVAVVQVLSSRGVEYWMMTLALYLGAGGLLGILLALINGGASFQILSFPVALLLVCLPVFSYFFLRLKKAELADPKLRMDPSKRRLTQFTQVITFAICLFTVIGIVYAILASIGGHGLGPLWKYLLNSVIVLLVAGGILYYYWRDEH